MRIGAPAGVVGDLARAGLDAVADRGTVRGREQARRVHNVLVVTGQEERASRGRLGAVADGVDDADLAPGVVLARAAGEKDVHVGARVGGGRRRVSSGHDGGGGGGGLGGWEAGDGSG